LTVATKQIFTSRLSRLALLDGEGLSIGRVRDVVILPAAGGEPPRALGLVAAVQRRNIFVNLGRVAEFSVDGVRLQGGTVDLGRFSSRPEELLASNLYHQVVDGKTVLDVGLVTSSRRPGGWDVSTLALGSAHALRRRTTEVVPWDAYPQLFSGGAMAEQMLSLRDMHPTDLAGQVELMSLTRRQQLAAALQDEEIADLLEEMPEPDQIRFLNAMDLERRADIVEEMEPDDAADLLAEMPPDQRERLLAAMETVDAAEVRRLLRYDATTAGGLMTSQPVIVAPTVPVGEVLARIRQPELRMAAATSVYVCEPPTTTPTGRFLGGVGFQRLLREPPSAPIGDCVQDVGFIRPDVPQSQVAARFAAYNLVSVAVCDDLGRLVGAVTVDDVVDRLLPAGWRRGGQVR
jgi:CBS domain-containing protein